MITTINAAYMWRMHCIIRRSNVYLSLYLYEVKWNYTSSHSALAADSLPIHVASLIDLYETHETRRIFSDFLGDILKTRGNPNTQAHSNPTSALK